MANTCQAIVGYLIPRRSCKNLPDSTCSRCRVEICHQHSIISATTGQITCMACNLPTELNAANLQNEVYFTEEDLHSFAEAYQQQKGKKGAWVDFT